MSSEPTPTIDPSVQAALAALEPCHRLLFNVPLRPVQGAAFQPTGFPGLGAAEFTTSSGTRGLLVESAQSMANRLEAVCWDEGKQEPVAALAGLSHVRVTRKGAFFTDTMLEAHRLNSPYLLEAKDRAFLSDLKKELGSLGEGPIDRRHLATVLLKFDAGSLLHGVFLAKKELAGGRLRVPRALSAFIEADRVNTVASGGVKNDHVNPQGNTKDGYGNVPFARDAYTGDITLYVNLDLALLRGYGLSPAAVHMLTLLALYKVALLCERELRLRTACDLMRVDEGPLRALRPAGFTLPAAAVLARALQAAIAAVRPAMVITTCAYEDELKKGKDSDDTDDAPEGQD